MSPWSARKEPSRELVPAGLVATIAYHEAGHAVAGVLACRNAHLPPCVAKQSVKYAAVLYEPDGQASGVCLGATLYGPTCAFVPELDWRDAMEWQIVIDLAGGVTEAVHGERCQRAIMWFTMTHYSTSVDLVSAVNTLMDLNKLKRTGRHYGLRRFVPRTLKLVLANWPVVEAIAAVLIRDGSIDGAEIERIVYAEAVR